MDILSTYIKDIEELEIVLRRLVTKGFVTFMGTNNLGQNIWTLTEKGKEFCEKEMENGKEET